MRYNLKTINRFVLIQFIKVMRECFEADAFLHRTVIPIRLTANMEIYIGVFIVVTDNSCGILLIE